jgi:predicted SnoaL-like aldol condensation-catalyzing enzyme
VSCWESTTPDGLELSGIEVFRVVGDKIVETWNSKAMPATWG